MHSKLGVLAGMYDQHSNAPAHSEKMQSSILRYLSDLKYSEYWN